MTPHPILLAIVYVAFLVCLAYSAVLYAFVAYLLVLSRKEARERRAESALEDFGALEGSRFTIPVSIVAAAYNEEVAIVPVVRLLLAQDYPEYEVIIVNDGSLDRTLELLREAFDLATDDPPARGALPSAPVRAIYRSRRDPRLTVIDKENGGKADALNCGINFARYRYLCCVDGDTAYFRGALERAMRPAMQDPESVVGVSSLFVVSRQPESEGGGGGGPRRLDPQLLSNFQYVDLLRSFLCYRLAWSRQNFMLCNPGGFAVWRRDAIFEVGGFSRDFSCEDIEVTFRVHERLRAQGRPCRVLTLPDIVGATEGPGRVADLSKQRVRWQRVVVETVWAYRRIFGRPRYGTVGLVGMPYYVFYEALAPVFQVVSLATLVLAIWLRILQWPYYLYLVGIIIFATAIPTSAAIHFDQANLRGYRVRDVVRLLLLGLLDFFLYRPVLLWAGARGTWGFLRGDKTWNKFVRNPRASAAP
jgi:cellulose synthase/poly-beta-1,6-N-acetylglucosamine synthase-like glycosyltransferase